MKTNFIMKKLFYIWGNGEETLEGVNTPKSAEYLVVSGFSRIANNAFKNHTNLKHVEIRDGLKSIGRSAFAGCKNLTTVDFGNTVKEIGEGAFYGCENLKSAKLPASVEKIEAYAFAKCGDFKLSIDPRAEVCLKTFIPNCCSKLVEVAMQACSCLISQKEAVEKQEEIYDDMLKFVIENKRETDTVIHYVSFLLKQGNLSKAVEVVRSAYPVMGEREQKYLLKMVEAYLIKGYVANGEILPI